MLQDIVEQVDGSEAQLQALQKAAQLVLVALPASQAKLAVQKQLFGIKDKFEEYAAYISSMSLNLCSLVVTAGLIR